MRKTRYQTGSLKRVRRAGGREVWVFRWRETGSQGQRRPRKLVIGTVKELRTESMAWMAVEQLGLNINHDMSETAPCPGNMSALIQHYTEKELTDDDAEDGKSFATKDSYRGYLRKWIVPRWGNYALAEVKAVAVEEWLRKDVPLARGSKAKIRNIMHVVFEHALRHEWITRNPVTQVRQSGKRMKVPTVLEVEEIQKLLAELPVRERVMVFLDCGTGLRLGELIGLKWEDVDFCEGTVRVQRSVVKQRVGPCKTEASQKDLPLHELLLNDLQAWRAETPYAKASDWIFASPQTKGKLPLWGQPLMRFYIRPAAAKAGISKRIGWHTFRHTYATLLKANGEDVKVVQELMRHASSAITMNLYAQAPTPQKRLAQAKLVQMIATQPAATEAVM